MSRWSVEKLEELSKASRKPAGDDDDPKERTRLRIVAAASDAFAHFGYRKASIDDIARRAGVGKGTIYLYYESKKDLIIGCIAEEKMALLPKMAEVFGAPEEERFERYLQVVFDFALTAPLSGALMRREHDLAAIINDWGDAAFKAQQSVGEDFIGSLLDPGDVLDPEERHRIVAAITGVAYLLPHLTDERVLMGVSVEDFGLTLARMLARGARP